MFQNIIILGNHTSLLDDEKKLIEEKSRLTVIFIDKTMITPEEIIEKKPTVILFSLEESDSKETFFLLAKIIRKTDIPVIVLSDQFEQDLFNKVKEIQPNIYLVRPFSKYQLIASIELLISKKTSTEKIKKSEKDKDLLIEKLGESVLKLRCLYSLSEMMMEPEIEIDDILKDITNKINSSIHNPEKMGVRIKYFNREFLSENYKDSDYKIKSEIMVSNEKAGVIELTYIHDIPNIEDSLSFREDRNLIKAIAERIGAIAERIETLKELERTNDELRNMSDYLRTIREEERKKISREIHDELGQALTGIRMGIVWLMLKLDEKRDIREKKLASMLRIAEGSIEAVRKIASELRPGILDNLGLVSAVEWLAEEIESRSSIKCTVSIKPDEIIVPEDLKVNIFRIIQEATTNTIRYAKAKNIRIFLDQNKSVIKLCIRDDGCGISSAAISDSYSYGIIGMRERTKSMKGTFSINGILKQGTTISIKVPCAPDLMNTEEDYNND